MNACLRFAVFLLVLLAFPAQATVYCIRDLTELGTALSAVQNNQQDDEIRIRTGNYIVPLGTNFAASVSDGRNLAISGGWEGSNNTCATQLPKAAYTTLRRNGSDIGRLLQLSGGSATGTQISVSNLSFVNGQPPVGGDGGCLLMNSLGQVLRLERVLLLGCLAPGGDGGGAYLAGPQLRVVGNAVAENEATRGGALYLQVTGNEGRAYVNSNSIIENTAAGLAGQAGGLQLAVAPTAQVFMTNNLFWSNSAGTDRYDIKIESGEVLSFHDHFNTASGSFLFAPVNRTFGDARLTPPDNLVPQYDSPCRDSGDDAAPGGMPAIDLDGNPRPLGSGYDRGAYEVIPPDPIFANGFQTPTR